MPELHELKNHQSGSQATADAIRLRKSFLLWQEAVKYVVQRGEFATLVDEDGKRTGPSVHVPSFFKRAPARRRRPVDVVDLNNRGRHSAKCNRRGVGQAALVECQPRR